MSVTIFFILLLLSVGYFGYEVYRRYRYTKLGKPENRSDNLRERWLLLLNNVLLQKKICNLPLIGLFHGFIMWGFVILLLSTIDMASLGLFQTPIPIIGDNSAYLFIRDTFIVLVLIGVFGLIIRRKFFRPDWLHSSPKAYALLSLILVIIFSEFIYFSAHNINNLRLIEELSWWVHFIAIFLFFLIIPHTKHLHLVFAPLNVFFSFLRPKGSIQPVYLSQQNEQAYGVKTLVDFSWKQLFDAFSCVECGRCHGFCPSERSGERLKPKKISGRLRTQMEANAQIEENIVGGMFHHDFIWSCTTCGSCNEVCPVFIDNMSKLIDMRRNIVSEKKDIPPEMNQVFWGIETYGNPLGINPRHNNNQAAWIRDLGIPTLTQNPEAEYLFYVGCQATYDKSAQKAIYAFVRILQTSGVDFAVLGEKEWCCGETVRRMGNELLFQKVVNKNIEQWAELGIKKIITACPHCYNTLKNEYTQFGGNYEVIPHTVFLTDLQRQGKLKTALRRNIKVTYHDPCYLGRYNNVYNEQREILLGLPGISLIEMPRSKVESFCCGAGGGRFWTRHKEVNPISTNRVNEALATGAEIIITSCPYCNKIFNEKIEEASDNKNNILTLDIAEFLTKPNLSQLN